MENLNNVAGHLSSWGILFPCALLFFAGCVNLTGYLLNWSWMYKKYPSQRWLLLVRGVTLIVLSAVIYLFLRDLW